MKFNNEKSSYDKLKMNHLSRSAHSVDPNKTIIKIFNTKDNQEDSFKKIKILNNLNKNSNLDVISKYHIPTGQDKRYIEDYKMDTNTNEVKDIFGKPAKIKVDLSKEIKRNTKLINDLKEYNQIKHYENYDKPLQSNIVLK